MSQDDSRPDPTSPNDPGATDGPRRARHNAPAHRRHLGHCNHPPSPAAEHHENAAAHAADGTPRYTVVDNVVADAERETIALLTATMTDPDVAADAVLSLAMGPSARRLFVGFLLADRAAAWNLDVRPACEHGDVRALAQAHTFANLVAALSAGCPDDTVRQMLREQLVEADAGHAGAFLMTAASQVVHTAEDLTSRLRAWGLQVAANPAARPATPHGHP